MEVRIYVTWPGFFIWNIENQARRIIVGVSCQILLRMSLTMENLLIPQLLMGYRDRFG
jgi:hypothetical protein